MVHMWACGIGISRRANEIELTATLNLLNTRFLFQALVGGDGRYKTHLHASPCSKGDGGGHYTHAAFGRPAHAATSAEKRTWNGGTMSYDRWPCCPPCLGGSVSAAVCVCVAGRGVAGRGAAWRGGAWWSVVERGGAWWGVMGQTGARLRCCLTNVDRHPCRPGVVLEHWSELACTGSPASQGSCTAMAASEWASPTAVTQPAYAGSCVWSPLASPRAPWPHTGHERVGRGERNRTARRSRGG